MENKINVAELLKDCPEGMELDSTLFDDIYFDCIDDVCDIIKCYIQESKHKIGISFDKYGHYSNISKSKCVIFPKGKTTWEGFVPPCQFKDGDIVYVKTKGHNQNEFIIIFQGIRNDHIQKYVCFAYQMLSTCKAAVCHLVDVEFMRLATEEEKQKLFKAIRDKGYKWDTKTKTLGKLPKFKIGDRIRKKGDYISGFITLIDFDNFYKVEYDSGSTSYVSVQAQDEWELVPDKFDIDTLKPFDKVLVRNSDKGRWVGQFYTFYDFMREYPFECVYNCWKYCIPYEKNEHLLGTANDCDEYYKNWE